MVGTLAAVIPFAYSIATGESAAAIAVVGAAVAIVGLVLITSTPAAAAVVKRGLPWALLSGIGYGSGQIALIETAEASGAWPGFAQRGTAFLGLVLVARVTRVAVVPSRGYRKWGLLSGIGSGLATIFILAGLHVDVVPTIVTASMFPAASVFVGWLYFRDEISRTQVVGLAVVLAGVAGVVAG